MRTDSLCLLLPPALAALGSGIAIAYCAARAAFDRALSRARNEGWEQGRLYQLKLSNRRGGRSGKNSHIQGSSPKARTVSARIIIE